MWIKKKTIFWFKKSCRSYFIVLMSKKLHEDEAQQTSKSSTKVYFEPFDCIILGTMLKSSCVCWVHSRLSLWTSEKLLWNQRVEVQKAVCLFWLLTKILKCTLQSVFKTSKKCFVRLEKYVSAYLIMLITVENFEQINK